MKYKRVVQTLTFPIMLSLLVAALPSGVALAATPAIVLSAPSGTVGSSLTVTGTEFTANTTGNVIFGFGSSFATSYPVTLATNVGGNFSISSTVPTVPGGTYTISATVGSTANSSFTVTPMITLTPSSVHTRDSVSVSGTGFTVGLNATITLDTVTVATVATNTDGTFSVPFVIPSTVHGTHTVAASTGTPSASAPLSLTPSAGVSPISGQVGSTTSVSGEGFGGNSAIVISFDTISIAQATTDANGSFSTTITVPPSAGGTHTITASIPPSVGVESAAAVFTSLTGLHLSQSSAGVGTSLTASGAAFGYNTLVSISIDSTQIIQALSDANGSFSIGLTVPVSTGGAHTITGSDGSFSASIALTVQSGIKVNPVSGNVSSPIAISGTGFSSTTPARISFDGTLLTTVNTDAAGSFNANATVPPSPAGNHTLSASDGTFTSNNTFATLAAVALSSSRGPMGAPVTVMGTGFAAGGTITIQMGSTVVKKTSADAKGSFNDQFTVPQLDAGNYAVTGGDGTNSAGAVFTITSSFKISPTLGNVGSSVVVSGTGFTGAVTIKYDDSVMATAATSGNGAFSATFVVPVSVRGGHTVSVNDAATRLQLPFTVTPNFSISPSLGYIGGNIAVSGTGFTGPVTVKYDGSVVATATAAGNGAFSATFKAPVSIHGAHVVSVNDAVTSLQSTFSVDPTPPPLPELLQPQTGVRQGKQATMTWTPVTDPNGVTYTLQVASSANFTSLILERGALTAAQYQLTSAEGLPTAGKNTPYYWRVKAVDLAQNESNWSTVRSFYVTLLPPWVFSTIIGAGILLAGLFVYWLGARTRRRLTF